MARSLPTVGDTVKVYVVGSVTRVDPTTGVDVRTVAGATARFAPALRDDDGFAWELEPSPEPVYVAGEMYADARGDLFLRNDTEYPGDRWTAVRSDSDPAGRRVAESRPSRPLKRMIPEGGS